VLNATPQGPNNAVIWIKNEDAVTAGDITLDNDNSTIKTYKKVGEEGFVLDSFSNTRQEIGLHGMANAGSVPLAFDDLSISIMGRKE
jgi:hypothetical protein